MFCYSVGTAGLLVLFPLSGPGHGDGSALLVGQLVVLLACAGGMIVLLSPYAAEVYPTALRAGGSGLAAAGSKVGGMSGRRC